MRKSLLKLHRPDKAASSNRSTLIIVGIFVVIFVASYVFSGGFGKLSGKPTITANLNVTDSGLLTPSEKYSISVSNVSGNLSQSNVYMSITDSYGTTTSLGFKNGVINLQISEPGVSGSVQQYVYHITATGGGSYLTNTTRITITVNDGTPTHVSNIALIDGLSGGTIASWSP